MTSIIVSAIGSGLLSMILTTRGWKLWQTVLAIIAIHIIHFAYLLPILT